MNLSKKAKRIRTDHKLKTKGAIERWLKNRESKLEKDRKSIDSSAVQ